MQKALRVDAQRNRDAIVAAARSIFDSGEQLRFDDFAARAGVGVGTLYRHFATREALAAAVYEDEVSALCTQAQDPTRSAGEDLDAFLRKFVEYVVTHAGLARALATAVAPSVQTVGGIQLENTVADLMQRAAHAGAIRSTVSVGAVMIALHGIGVSSTRPLWESESRETTELLIAGLKRLDHRLPLASTTRSR